MTHATFAPTHPSASKRGDSPPAYRPGVCNIGPAEIARRRRAGHIGLIATIVGFVGLVAVGAPPLSRVLLALPAAVAASGYLQAWLKFCAAFGSLGVFNLGGVGEHQTVVDEGARRRDRRRAMQIGLSSVVVGVIAAVAAFLVPL